MREAMYTEEKTRKYSRIQIDKYVQDSLEFTLNEIGRDNRDKEPKCFLS